MTTNDADRLLTAWLEAAAPTREPEHLLGAVLERTSRTRRRAAWRIPERWIPMTTATARVTPGARLPLPAMAVGVLLILALVAGLVLFAGSRPKPLPAPFGPAGNGILAYAVDGTILSIDPGTSRTSTITSTAAGAIAPAFSHDGAKVAWVEVVSPDAPNGTLMVARADGSDARSLGEYAGFTGGAWSPDGDHIAIVMSVDGTPSISMVDVATGTSTVLPIGMPVDQLGFRPDDGSQLVVRGQEPDGTWGLYLVNADGTDPRRLELDAGFQDTENYAGDRDFYFLDPAWSPDGTRLAFHTLEDSLADPDPGFRVHVADVDPAGVVTREVTLDPGIAIDDEFAPQWLPDGSGLVVHRVEEVDHSVIRWDIGEELQPLTGGVALETGRIRGNPFDLRFLVSPDGSTVLVWKLGDPAQLVPTSGAPALSTELVVGEDVAWQRTAQSAP